MLDSAGLEQLPLKNDFEPAVFQTHPELAAVVRKLRRLGAKPAMMTGSGSAVFGVFGSVSQGAAGGRAFRAGAHLSRSFCKSAAVSGLVAPRIGVGGRGQLLWR